MLPDAHTFHNTDATATNFLKRGAVGHEFKRQRRRQRFCDRCDGSIQDRWITVQCRARLDAAAEPDTNELEMGGS